MVVTSATFLFGLFGCATAPKNFSEYKEGSWQGKVLVHDKKEGHSAILNLNVRAVDGSLLRLDITSPTGTHLGSLLIKNSEVLYMNVGERTVTKSKLDHAALQSVMRVPLEASLLFNILFDRAPFQKNWECKADQSEMLKTCTDSKAGILVNWVRRERDQRTIEIDHSAANLQMSLYGFNPKIADPEKAFELKVPSAFRVINK